METMKIRMLYTIAGSCDGQQTRAGNIVDVGKNSAMEYIARGAAEVVAEEKKAIEEKAEEIDRSGIRTAEAAPPDNAAEHVAKPEPRRGPGRPRKQE